MTQFPKIQAANLEAICKILADATTGRGIDQHLEECRISDTSGDSTKWRRLYETFSDLQRDSRSSSHLSQFVKSLLFPQSYIERSDEFEDVRTRLNQYFMSSGLEYRDDGEFHRVDQAMTLSEAQRRSESLHRKLKGRSMHDEVLKYCKIELLQDNYFHAVFEASKGLAQRIREKSGVEEDGAKLVDTVFSINNPVLAINSLQTETEKSEHKGFAQLLKGCFSAIRNPLAHKPKLLWQGVEDAVDYLTLISLMHRKLDQAVVVPRCD